MDRPTAWVDITNAMRSGAGRLTGIARLELEVAAALADEGSIRFIRYDPKSDQMQHVSAAEVHDTLDRRAHSEAVLDPKGSASRRQVSEPGRIRAQGRRLAGKPRHKGLARAVLALRSDLTAARRSWSNVLRETRKWAWRPKARPSECASRDWLPGDVVCGLGLWEGQRSLETLERVARERSVRIAQVIYDLIPVLKPQYRAIPRVADHALFRHLLSMADVAMPISRSTTNDIIRFCHAEGIPVPECRPIRIGSSVVAVPPKQPTLPDWVDEFVLCVGTIEIRKNHHLLLDVWESYVTEPGPRSVPTLVVAGSIGWLNTETLHRLRCTPGFERHVVFVENPSDGELSWLYRHCSITVYPSFYEGWGLPITESLDAGKLCLTSNVSSMPEAAEGLGVLLDPRDWRAWRSAIDTLLGDPTTRARMEATIASSHTVVTASDVAAQVRAVIDELVHGPL